MAAGPGGMREGVFKNFPTCHQCDADFWNSFLDTTYQATDSYPILYRKRGFKLEIPQIPSNLVVDRWDSDGEDRSPLDFTFPRNVWWHHPSHKNANNINRLRVYY